jgi:tRNA modification GTPase
LAAQLASRRAATPEFRVVLMGWPNVGKSSLMNALAGESAALVSALAGTTRDYLARRIEIEGVSCLLIDTAGWEPGADGGVKAAAQQATVGQLEQADLQLFCLDATRHLHHAEQRVLATRDAERCLLVLTKVDGLRSTDLHLPAIPTSSRTGEGLPALRDAIRDRAIGARSHDSCVVAGTVVRCRESLRLATECLAQARATARARAGDELVAADLRACLEELGKIVGTVYSEDVLDRIFSRFCIGK